MVREAHNYQSGNCATLSSIALLQERFRQLQKMKELRQEKELLRILSESTNRIVHPQSKTSLLGSEIMFLPPKPHCQLSLSLWPDSVQDYKHADSIRVESEPKLPKSWFADVPAGFGCASPIKIENCGSDHVDTSLRL